MSVNKSLKKLIIRYDNERKNIRKLISDIALFTEGAYQVRDLWAMPGYYVTEIYQGIIDKNEREQEAMNSANTTSY